MSMEFQDLFVKGVSSCCSAKVYEPDVCADCKEHCEAVPEDEEKDISPRDDMYQGATDLEGALEKILFTPLPVKLVKNIYCQRCDAKKKVPAGTVEIPCECGATMK